MKVTMSIKNKHALTLQERRVLGIKSLLNLVSEITNQNVTDARLEEVCKILHIPKDRHACYQDELAILKGLIDNPTILLNIPHIEIDMPTIERSSKVCVAIEPQFDSARAIKKIDIPNNHTSKKTLVKSKTAGSDERVGYSISQLYTRDQSGFLFEQLYKSKVNRSLGFDGSKGVATVFAKTLSEKQNLAGIFQSSVSKANAIIFFTHQADDNYLSKTVFEVNIEDMNILSFSVRDTSDGKLSVCINNARGNTGIELISKIQKAQKLTNEYNDKKFLTSSNKNLIIEKGYQVLLGKVIADAVHQQLRKEFE